MKSPVVLALTLSLLSACTSPDAVERPAGPKRAMEIADLYRCAGLSAPALSPDGRLVAFSVRRNDLEGRSSTSELWCMRADGSGLRQLTEGSSDTDPVFSPDGQRLLFSSARDGGGQLWTLDLDGGAPRRLTDWPPGLGSAVWSPDGRWIAATSDVFPDAPLDAGSQKARADALEKGPAVHVADDLYYRHWTSWYDGRRAHILLVDARSGEVAKDLTPGDFESPTFSLGGRGFDFSPDGRELCYLSNHDADEASSTNADLWVVPLDGEIGEATARNLTAENKGWDGAPLYSPDGRFLAWVSQETPGYESDLRRLAVLDRASGATRYLTDRASFDFWVDDMRWTDDSQALVFEAEHHGRNPLYRIPVAGGRPEELLRHATIAGWELTDGGAGVVYTCRSVGEPTEVYSASFADPGPRRLTTMNAAIADEVDFRPAEELWLPGDGDYQVHCFLVKPHGFDPARKYPLILNVHGGPQQQWTDAFRGDWQVYPARGYVVAFCNPTGSTGYGQDFTDGITGDWGGRVYRDLMKVTDALEQLPFVDKDRLGVMGWSYGGYMAMWMQGHTTRFKCSAAMMGVYDLEAEYGATEELWFPEHDFRGRPWDSADYETWSPSNFVKEFRTPSLVITGELDYRVPYTQSLAYYTALRKMGVPARLVVFPNAGHWPSWEEMAVYYREHLEFFDRWLGGRPGAIGPEIDRKTGEQLWSKSGDASTGNVSGASGEALLSPIVVSKSVLLAGGGREVSGPDYEGVVRAYDQASGTLVWSKTCPGADFSKVAAVGQRAFVATTLDVESSSPSIFLAAYDLLTGEQLRDETYGPLDEDPVLFALAAAGSRVAVVGFQVHPGGSDLDALVRVHDARTGEFLWDDIHDAG